jgi:serine/threonine protein kinase
MWMILNGVAYIHDCKIIHRDISPKNILISDLGIIKICDFDDAWVESDNGDEKRGEMRFEVGTRFVFYCIFVVIHCLIEPYFFPLKNLSCTRTPFFFERLFLCS